MSGTFEVDGKVNDPLVSGGNWYQKLDIGTGIPLALVPMSSLLYQRCSTGYLKKKISLSITTAVYVRW